MPKVVYKFCIQLAFVISEKLNKTSSEHFIFYYQTRSGWSTMDHSATRSLALARFIVCVLIIDEWPLVSEAFRAIHSFELMWTALQQCIAKPDWDFKARLKARPNNYSVSISTISNCFRLCKSLVQMFIYTWMRFTWISPDAWVLTNKCFISYLCSFVSLSALSSVYRFLGIHWATQVYECCMRLCQMLSKIGVLSKG